MKLLGFDISRKSPVPATTVPQGWSWDWLNHWTNVIQEPFTGAWQRNQELRVENILTHYAVYACINLIASDIGKLRLRLIQKMDENIFKEVDVPAFSPVLRLPNRFQTRQQFVEHWQSSKLTRGNTYVLKERDQRNAVVALYVLNPDLTKPMVGTDGSIWYSVATDALSGIDKTDVMIPESEIIHDRFLPLGGHPLCGVSPITACGLAALQGLNIQRTSNKFFSNGAKPSGILTSPQTISDITAKRLKDEWEANYTGNNIGKVAILGDGLKYDGIMVSASDAQLINQLKWTAENVCTAFLVPPHKISIGQMPNYNNIESLDQNYYSGCLQKLIEAMESCLDKGLGLEKTELPYETNFNLDDLLKMDTPTRIKTYGDGVRASIFTTNEARSKMGMGKVAGGDVVLTQQQNYSLEAIAKRDSQADPFGKQLPAAPKKPPASGDQNLPPPEPQKLLPAPPTDWSMDAVLKGFRDAAA